MADREIFEKLMMSLLIGIAIKVDALVISVIILVIFYAFKYIKTERTM